MTDWDTMRALLAGIPALDGARCKTGQADLFERTIAEHHMTGRLTKTEVDNARRDALRLCETCPALNPCRAWLSALPAAQRPHGVVAGQVITAGGMPSRTRTRTEPDEQPAPGDRRDVTEHAHLVRPRTQGDASPHPAQGAPRGIGDAPPDPPKKNNERTTEVMDREDLRAAMRDLFGDVGERPPGPRYQMTVEAVEDYSRRWTENLGAGRFTSIDVDIVTDADGTPLAVGRSVETFQFNSLLVDRAHAERLGIAEAIAAGDYPGVEVFDPHAERGES